MRFCKWIWIFLLLTQSCKVRQPSDWDQTNTIIREIAYHSYLFSWECTYERQTNSLTPYTGVCSFFLSVKFATSLLASLAGDYLMLYLHFNVSLLPVSLFKVLGIFWNGSPTLSSIFWWVYHQKLSFLIYIKIITYLSYIL